jgi:hypothetical protein
LHVEDVAELAIVALGPELIAATGVDELDRDAYALAGFAAAATSV